MPCPYLEIVSEEPRIGSSRIHHGSIQASLVVDNSEPAQDLFEGNTGK